MEVKKWVRGSALASGSHATVFLAISARDGKLMAVKTVTEGTTEALYLRNELEILEQVQCPYVVQCFGGEKRVEDGVEVFNVLMEYMPAGTVSDLVRSFSGGLPETAIRSYTRCMLLGLQQIHEVGFVHGDVKGKNVLVGCNGTAKLADFGCSRKVSELCGENKKVTGTPLWMAPEVIRHQQQGPASDVWSLGCTVIELASGKVPWSELFNGSQVFGVMDAMVRVAMSNAMPGFQDLKVSSELKDFLSKCLVRDALKRWSCDELLAHPFISHGDTSSPLSPISVFDLEGSRSFSPDSDDADSTKCKAEVMDSVSVSAKDRIQKLACAEKKKKSGSFFDDLGDHHWIDVREMPLKHDGPAVDGKRAAVKRKLCF